MLNVKQSADFTGDSIPLHNRFQVFNNTDYFPESALTGTKCEQEMVCLHIDQKSKRENVEKNKVRNSRNSANTTKSSDTSVENHTEHVVEKLCQVTENSDKKFQR